MKRLLFGLIFIVLAGTASLAFALFETKESANSEYPPGVFNVYSTWNDGLNSHKNPLYLKRVDWHDGNGPVTSWISISGPNGLGEYSIMPVRKFNPTEQNIRGVRE